MNLKNSSPATLILGGFLILALTQSCSRENATAARKAPTPPAVTVQSPIIQPVTRYAEYTGTTEAVESVDIRARVEGVISKIFFAGGDLVRKGDLLYAIEDDSYQIQLDEAQAQLAVRNGELKLALATSRRRQQAFKDRAVSEVAVIEADAGLITARANVAAAKAAVERAQLSLSYTRIKAPISGRIARTLVDAGNLVGAQERTLLTTILKDDAIYAYFTVNERDLLRFRSSSGASVVSQGAKAFLGLSGGTGFPFEGSIDYIHNQVDAATGSILMRARFDNPDHGLMAGLFARIRLPLGQIPEALLVPDAALGQDQQGAYLLLADADNTVRHQPVTLGQRMNDLRVIAAGLTPTERVIVNGLQRAVPGRKVTPVQASAAEKTPNPAKTPPAGGRSHVQ